MQDQTAPLVSVVMPAYNADKYIEAAVRSVQTQTFPDWELILVDDCSTDGTADRICALAAEDGRLRPVFSAENHGAAESRLCWMRMISGGRRNWPGSCCWQRKPGRISFTVPMA